MKKGLERSIDRSRAAVHCPLRVRAFLMAILTMPGFAAAQGISIDAGASWHLGDALVELDCVPVQVAGLLDVQDSRLDGVGDVAISGQLTAAAASIEVGGNWSNQGHFAAGASTVHLSDRCDANVASISGSTSFSTLHIESERSKGYVFQAGQVQAVAAALRITGMPGAPLVLGSTQAGIHAELALAEGGSQQIAWIDVADMAAPEGSAWLAQGPPEDFDSVDSGNNFRWFEPAAPAAPPVAVPADSRWALLLLALALLVLARRGFRSTEQPARAGASSPHHSIDHLSRGTP